MNRRALFIALVVAGLGVFLLFLYQKKFETEASGGEKIKLLITVKPIERGTVITEEMVATREIPQAYVEDRAVKEVEKAKVIGLRVGNTLQAQQTIMWPDLVTANEERRDLSTLVQPGNRGVSVSVSREDSSVALIRPGDYVDVIGVMQPNKDNENTRSAVVLLQRVLVLAAGLETSAERQPTNPDDPNANRLEGVLTLSLTIPEAQLLSLAAEKGRVTVALRNPADQRTAERIPDVTSDQILNSGARSTLPIRGNGPKGPTSIPEGAR